MIDYRHLIPEHEAYPCLVERKALKRPLRSSVFSLSGLLLPGIRLGSEYEEIDGFFCGCRLIFFCFMMLRLNGLLYGFTDGNVPALRNPPAAFNIAVYIEFMFHDYTK